jgi:hypothetical protein
LRDGSNRNRLEHHGSGDSRGVQNAIAPRVAVAVQRGEIVGSIDSLGAALEAVRSDPDDLYITTYYVGSRRYSIWPDGRATQPVLGGESVLPNVSVNFDEELNFYLFDYDAAEPTDDLLGSIHITESLNEDVALFAFSEEQSSAYYVTCAVS